MKFVIDKAIPYISGVLEPYAEVAYLPADAITREDAADADMLIIRTRTRCDRRLLEGSRVQLIATATIGFDHIDLEYCASHGIEVVTAQGCNAAGVLQWMGAALAALAADGGWAPQHKCLGIVGVGHVGGLVEQYPHMRAYCGATRRGSSAKEAISCRWSRSPPKPTYSPCIRRSTPQHATWSTAA